MLIRVNKDAYVFLSSPFNSPHKEWREEIFTWATRQGYAIWNPETDIELDSLWKDFSTQSEEHQKTVGSRTEDICLEAVRHAKFLIAVLDKDYGKTHELDDADTSVLEMEIIQALLSQIPTFIFVSNRAEPGTRLFCLIRILQMAISASVYEFTAHTGPVRKIKAIIEANYCKKRQHRAGDHRRLITEFCRFRHPVRAEPDLGKETGFLEHKWMPRHDFHVPNGSLIDNLVAKAQQDDGYNTRLLYLWRAIRHLAASSFTEKTNSNWLPRWNLVLSEWSSAAAWSGLHGHMLIGRRASVISLLQVKKALAEMSAQPDDQIGYLLSQGELASEYYSIAKLVTSSSVRNSVLDSAESCVHRALSAFPASTENIAVSNQLAILGSVQLLAGRSSEGIKTLRKVLDVRLAIGAAESQLADAKSELGFALFKAGRRSEGKGFLEDGVAYLERTMKGGFTIRAKRKLGVCYLKTYQLRKAYDQFLQVEALIEHHEAAGQSSIIESTIATLRNGLGLPLRKLKVEKTGEGYRYIG